MNFKGLIRINNQSACVRVCARVRFYDCKCCVNKSGWLIYSTIIKTRALQCFEQTCLFICELRLALVESDESNQEEEKYIDGSLETCVKF